MPKDSIKRTLELINEGHKVTKCKNIQKSVSFLSTKNEFTEKKIAKAIPFTIETHIHTHTHTHTHTNT
jgi:hypothetical protein